MFWLPRTFEALLTCVDGNKVKLGDFDRVGEVALRTGGPNSGVGGTSCPRS